MQKKPYIGNYEDAYSYLTKGGNSLGTALSLYYFHEQLRDSISHREGKIKRSLTREEIDAVVGENIGARHLDKFLENAESAALNYLYDRRHNRFMGKLFPIYGAWSGFLGNMLTFFVGFIVAVFITVYKDDNMTTAQRLKDFYTRCFVSSDVN